MMAELRKCSFCGELPEITKHFEVDAWLLVHRCKVISSFSFEWGDRDAHVRRWNSRYEEDDGAVHRLEGDPKP